MQRLLNDCRNTIRNLMPEDPGRLGGHSQCCGDDEGGSVDGGALSQDFGSPLPFAADADLDGFEGDNESQENDGAENPHPHAYRERDPNRAPQPLNTYERRRMRLLQRERRKYGGRKSRRRSKGAEKEKNSTWDSADAPRQDSLKRTRRRQKRDRGTEGDANDAGGSSERSMSKKRRRKRRSHSSSGGRASRHSSASAGPPSFSAPRKTVAESMSEFLENNDPRTTSLHDFFAQDEPFADDNNDDFADDDKDLQEPNENDLSLPNNASGSRGSTAGTGKKRSAPSSRSSGRYGSGGGWGAGGRGTGGSTSNASRPRSSAAKSSASASAPKRHPSSPRDLAAMVFDAPQPLRRSQTTEISAAQAPSVVEALDHFPERPLAATHLFMFAQSVRYDDSQYAAQTREKIERALKSLQGSKLLPLTDLKVRNLETNVALSAPLTFLAPRFSHHCRCRSPRSSIWSWLC